MQRDTQLLGDVDVGEAGRVGDDGVGYEGPGAGAAGGRREGLVERRVGAVRLLRRAQAVAGLDARTPAADDDLLDALAALGDLAALQGVQAGHEAGVLDHEGHQLGRVAADAEELQPVLLDEALEGRVGGQPHAVAVRLLQHLAQRHERLHVAARAHDLDHHVEPRRRLLARPPAQTGRDVGRRQRPAGRRRHLQRRRQQRRELAVGLIDVDVDPAVVWVLLLAVSL